MPYTRDGIGWQGTDTSLFGATEIADAAPNIQLRVAALLDAATRPMTSEEIAAALRLPYVSVQPRVSELHEAGRVRDSGQRKIGRYGRPIIAWEARRGPDVPPAQSDLFSEARA